MRKRRGPEMKIAELTRRERQVVELLCQGLTNREISTKLDISIKTVDTHRGHVLAKINARNNVGLLLRAIREGFVPVELPEVSPS